MGMVLGPMVSYFLFLKALDCQNDMSWHVTSQKSHLVMIISWSVLFHNLWKSGWSQVSLNPICPAGVRVWRSLSGSGSWSANNGASGQSADPNMLLQQIQQLQKTVQQLQTGQQQQQGFGQQQQQQQGYYGQPGTQGYSNYQQGGGSGSWGAPGGGRGGSRPPLPKNEQNSEEGVEEGQQVVINSQAKQHLFHHCDIMILSTSSIPRSAATTPSAT